MFGKMIWEKIKCSTCLSVTPKFPMAERIVRCLRQGTFYSTLSHRYVCLLVDRDCRHPLQKHAAQRHRPGWRGSEGAEHQGRETNKIRTQRYIFEGVIIFPLESQTWNMHTHVPVARGSKEMGAFLGAQEMHTVDTASSLPQKPFNCLSTSSIAIRVLP